MNRVLRNATLSSLILCASVLQAADQLNFNITAQSLGKALAEFSDQSGIRTFYADDLLAGITTKPIRGNLAPEAVLDQLLVANGLRYRFVGTDAVRIERPNSGDRTAADRDATDPQENRVLLTDIAVKGEILNETNTAFSVDVVDGGILQGTRLNQPERFLEEVPGISLRTIRQGGLANQIIMRGFTSGIHGGDMAVAVDGVMQNWTDSTGYSEISHIIPLDVERVIVYRGPVSPLYGNFQRGGAVAFTTRKGGEYQEADFTVGQWNTHDAQAAMGGKLGPLTANLAAQSYHTDGWAEDGRYARSNASSRFSYDVTESDKVSVSLNMHSGTWDARQFILEEQFLNSPRELPPNAEHDGGEKHMWQLKLDYNRILNENTKLLVFAYTSESNRRNWEKGGFLPGGQVERIIERKAHAAGISLNSNRELAGYPADWVLGAEYYHEPLDTQAWSSSFRVRGNPSQDRSFVTNTASVYGQLDWTISPRFRPTLGFRYDHFTGSYENNDPNGVPFKNDMNSGYNHLSPKFGVRSALSRDWDFRASVVNGYRIPDNNLKFDPDVNVDPTLIWQYEVGLSGTPIDSLYLDVAFYVIDTKDEINFNTHIIPPTFDNFGDTRRMGVEGQVRYATPVPYLEVLANYGWIDTEIRDNPDPDVIGKSVAFVPDYTATLSVNYAPPVGWGARATWRKVGPHMTDILNTMSYDGFDVLNASVFYSQSIGHDRRLRWFVDVNNVLDELYAEAVAFRADRSPNNIYIPAPPVNVAAGFNLTF